MENMFPYRKMPNAKIKSANRVIGILELLAPSGSGMKHKKIAEELDIPKGSLTKLLANLIDSSYLTFDSENKTYKLGSRILTLANSYISNLDIAQAAQPIIRDLVAKTDESCYLTIRDRNSALLVYRKYGKQPMSLRLEIGARIPLYATASGKAILAFLPKQEVDNYFSSVELRPFTHSTITDPATLLHELELVRSEQIAYSHEEQFEGLAGIAAPIFRSDGNVVASITIVYLSIRSKSVDVAAVKTALREASGELSKYLGFQSKKKIS